MCACEIYACRVKYAMRSTSRRGRPTTGVALFASPPPLHRRVRLKTTNRFRIQSAEFMRASQLDTRPVLFHGNVITTRLIRRGVSSSNRRQRVGVTIGVGIMAPSIIVLSRTENTESSSRNERMNWKVESKWEEV